MGIIRTHSERFFCFVIVEQPLIPRERSQDWSPPAPMLPRATVPKMKTHCLFLLVIRCNCMYYCVK